MSGKLLDTNVLIDLVSANSLQTEKNFTAAVVAGESLFLSTVSLFEYRFGAERSKRKAFQLEALERFLMGAALANFEAADAESAALIKGELAERGQMIGGYDLMIAGQALARGWTVVTGNTREFSRVDGLQLEDWSQAPA